MRKLNKQHFKVLPFLVLFLFASCIQDDSQIKDEENSQIERSPIAAKYITSDDVPHVMDYLLSKTNNSLQVDLSGEKIKLAEVNQTNRLTALGTVQTDKVVTVENEKNTKYTFAVKNEEKLYDKINLIVVDVDGVLFEYFIQYKFDSDNLPSRLESGAIDMSKFTGTLLFYDMDGVQVGIYNLVEGTSVSGEGFAVPPCPDDTNDSPNDDTDEPDNDNSGNTGGGNPGDVDLGDDPNDSDYDGNTNGGSTGGGGWLDDAMGCEGFSWSYGDCGCGAQYADGHEQTTNECCNGSPLIVTSCSGETWGSGRIADPCAEGDVGVLLLDLEIIEELENLLEENPYLLLEIDCDQIEHWQQIAQHEAPQAIKDKVADLHENYEAILGDWEIQELEDNGGTIVNMDYFGVNVTQFPNNPTTGAPYTPNEFLNHFRRTISSYTEPLTVFEPYCEIITLCQQETDLWNSDNPFGALIKLDISLYDGPLGNVMSNDGVVILSKYETNYWYFQTLEAPYDGSHPVTGTRQFGFETNADGSHNFFVRGVDRFSSNLQENLAYAATLGDPFAFADNLWEHMQENLKTYINENGGTSTVMTPIDSRPDWDKVREVLQGIRPISDLGCD